MAPPIAAFAQQRYGLVIDAGSSGSRLQLYAWRDPRVEREEAAGELDNGRWTVSGEKADKEKVRERLRRLPRVERGVREGYGDWQKKVEPGISTLASEATITRRAVAEYLAPLLSHALASIPPSLHAQTPVYLLATAGMRLLPQTHSDRIIQLTCDILREDYPFRVEDALPGEGGGPCGGSVRIISGEEEGLWGWVAVNYLMDGFGGPDGTIDPSSSSTAASLSEPASSDGDSGRASPDASGSFDDHPFSSQANTLGFLDMGGASTQIAFSPSPAEAAKHPSSLAHVNLRLLSGEEVSHDVFVASWLGYGTNKARERYVGLKVEEWELQRAKGGGHQHSQKEEGSIPDPCLPKTLLLKEKPKIPLAHLEGSPPADIAHATSMHALEGTGSFAECLVGLEPLLNKHLPCPAGPHECLFDGRPTPKIDFDQTRFIGVSEYWYSSEHVFNMGGAWDFLEFEKRATEFCGRDWRTIERGYEQSRLDEEPITGDGEVLDSNGEVKDVGKWGPKVEIPRLQMQCFKAAWLVNVLHEGIGLPRLVDPNGHRDLIDSPEGFLADTEREAAIKAQQKGLGHGPRFQSVDTVGDTAISWTLGKMVIEASKDVPSASPSSSFGGDWATFPERLAGSIGVGEHVDGYWLYAFILVGVVFLFVTRFRRAGGSILRASSPGRKIARWKKDLELEAEEVGGGGYLASNATLRPVSGGRRSGPGGPVGVVLSTILNSIRRVVLRHSSAFASSPAAGSSTSSRPLTLKHTSSSPAVLTIHDDGGDGGSVPSSSSASRSFMSQSKASSFYFPSPPNSPRKSKSNIRAVATTSSRQSSLDPSSGSSSDDTDGPLDLHVSASSPNMTGEPPVVDLSSVSRPPSSLSSSKGGPSSRVNPRRPSPNVGLSADFHLIPMRDVLGVHSSSTAASSSTSLVTSAIPGTSSSYHQGWNDPPETLFPSSSRSAPLGHVVSSSIDSPTSGGILTPPATGRASMSASRNSSRVDLLDLSGLTGRARSLAAASLSGRDAD